MIAFLLATVASACWSVLAQAAGASPPSDGYRPFIEPLPLWDYWLILLLPLCAAVAIVYKSVKCYSMREVPKEAAVILLWILVGMAVAAAVLAGVVNVLER